MNVILCRAKRKQDEAIAFNLLAGSRSCYENFYLFLRRLLFFETFYLFGQFERPNATRMFSFIAFIFVLSGMHVCMSLSFEYMHLQTNPSNDHVNRLRTISIWRYTYYLLYEMKIIWNESGQIGEEIVRLNYRHFWLINLEFFGAVCPSVCLAMLAIIVVLFAKVTLWKV